MVWRLAGDASFAPQGRLLVSLPMRQWPALSVAATCCCSEVHLGHCLVVMWLRCLPCEPPLLCQVALGQSLVDLGVDLFFFASHACCHGLAANMDHACFYFPFPSRICSVVALYKGPGCPSHHWGMGPSRTSDGHAGAVKLPSIGLPSSLAFSWLGLMPFQAGATLHPSRKAGGGCLQCDLAPGWGCKLSRPSVGCWQCHYSIVHIRPACCVLALLCMIYALSVHYSHLGTAVVCATKPHHLSTDQCRMWTG